MNAHTATNDELRDWLAESGDPSNQWKKKDGRWFHPRFHRQGCGQKRHPIPNTLDAAAAALPEGVDWYRDLPQMGRMRNYGAVVGDQLIACTPVTDDERTDRFRLAVLCIMAKEK